MSHVVADWSVELAALTPELATLYADWLPKLQAAFGPWRQPARRDPDGDPNGYGGLARRGSWERLLTTEWALAEAVPDEFVRRVAMGEQLFLQLERQVPAAPPCTRVWLDGGPDSLGAPRLAHLALLLVLQRRAQAAGGTLLWAALHDPERERDSLDPVEVLAQRTTRCPGRFAPPPGDEAFVVAAEPVQGARSTVVVREIAGRQLEVATPGATLRLDLPPVELVARALYEPRPRARPVVVPPRSGVAVEALRFVPGGGALLERRGDVLRAWAVPSGPRKAFKVRWRDPWYGTSTPLVAVGWSRQATVTLRITETGAAGTSFRLAGRDGSCDLPIDPDFVLPRPGTLHLVQRLPARLVSRHTRAPLRDAALVRDGADRVWLLDFSNRRSTMLGDSITDPGECQSTYAWIDRQGRLVQLHPVSSGGLPALQDFSRTEHRVCDRAFRSVPVASDVQHSVPRALEMESGVWWLGFAGGWGVVREQDVVRSRGEVVGAAVMSGAGGPRYLIEVVGTEVWRVSASERRVLAAFDAPIHVAAVGGRPSAPMVAVGTTTGWVHFQPLSGGEPWLSFLPSSDP
ncbi:MAG: hypothetical protein R3F61_31320 [Myxococcota bacterium]